MSACAFFVPTLRAWPERTRPENPPRSWSMSRAIGVLAPRTIALLLSPGRMPSRTFDVPAHVAVTTVPVECAHRHSAVDAGREARLARKGGAHDPTRLCRAVRGTCGAGRRLTGQAPGPDVRPRSDPADESDTGRDRERRRIGAGSLGHLRIGS